MTAFFVVRKASRNKGMALHVRFKVMGSSSTVTLVRRILGSVSLGASAAGFASIALGPSYFGTGLLIVAGVVGAGAIGLGLRSVRAQVLARGVAWTVLAPSLLGIVESFGRGHLPDAPSAFFGATSAAALLLARPLLHTPEARADFSPVGYRRLFLAGAVAAATAGTATLMFALEALLWGPSRPGLALASLGAVLLASAIGVARMRAWGVLLALVGSVAAIVGAVVSGNEWVGMGLALAAIPGVLLASPLLAARLGIGAGSRDAPGPTLRVTAHEAPVVRARVAAGEDEAVDEAVARPRMAAQ
ncbi:MAG TPA: hypothetical protein VIF09_10220 [Polyangiaceae bacterium]